MTYRLSQDRQTGTPPAPGVYVVAFKGKPLDELMSYWDGKSWGHGETGFQAALQGLRVGERLPFYKRRWWTPVLYWRVITYDKVSPADALRGTVKG